MILLYIKFGSGWLVGGWLRPKKKPTILLTYLVNGKSMGLDEVYAVWGDIGAREGGEGSLDWIPDSIYPPSDQQKMGCLSVVLF